MRCLLVNYGRSTLLTAYFLFEIGQGLLNRSYGSRKLIDCDNLLIHV